MCIHLGLSQAVLGYDVSAASVIMAAKLRDRIPPGSITEEQLLQLQADPDLDVELIDPPARKKKPAAIAEPEAGDGQDDAPESGDDGGEEFSFDEAAQAAEAPQPKAK